MTQQDSTVALLYLTSGRYFFLCAKRVRLASRLGDALLLIAALMLPAAASAVAVATFLWLAVTRLGLTQREEDLRYKGAACQWGFEREAFGNRGIQNLGILPPKEQLVAASLRMTGLVERRASRRWPGYRVGSDNSPLYIYRSWFPKDAITPSDSLDLQAASAEFALRMSRAWVALCLAAFTLVMVVLVASGLVRQALLGDFLLGLLLPASPLLIGILEEIFAARTSNHLREQVLIWLITDEGVGGCSARRAG